MTEKSIIEEIEVSMDQYFEIARELQNRHELFHKFWNMGRPTLTSSIPTACVSFDPTGTMLDFKFNPQFWAEKTPYQRTFIICHEALHVLLDHGKRASEPLFSGNPQLQQAANIALDTVVNHMLVEQFGFDRQLADPDNTAVWVEKLTKIGEPLLPSDMNYEFYYDHILTEIKKEEKQKQQGQTGGEGKPGEGIPTDNNLDDHSGLPNMQEEPGFSREVQDAVNEMNREQQESLKKAVASDSEPDDPNAKSGAEAKQNTQAKKAGTVAGGKVQLLPPMKVKRKPKWESVIKRWASKGEDDFSPTEAWGGMNRRTDSLTDGTDIVLPVEVERDGKDKAAIDVYFFLDTSYSCVHLGERFWKAAASLPPKKFKITLFCFDTKTYPVKLKDRQLKGFGGTAFGPIESQIQDDIRKGVISRYPKAVFLITDGEGTHVTPEFPKRWHWFMTQDYRHFIPKESIVHKLADFE
jgi:Putative metallopeptidase domain